MYEKHLKVYQFTLFTYTFTQTLSFGFQPLLPFKQSHDPCQSCTLQLYSFWLTDFLQMCFRPEEVSKSPATSVLLRICPEKPREPFQPYTSTHTQHNHMNVSLSLLNIPRNKNPCTHFSVQLKKTHFGKCQREKESRLQLGTDTGVTFSSQRLTLKP